MAEQNNNIRVQLNSLLPEHDYNKTYKILSIVSHKVNDEIQFYMAIKNVPRHVFINNTKYWKKLTKTTHSENQNN